MALKLQINQPIELTLTRPDPKRYQNGDRTSLMYSVKLPDGTEEKIFLPPSCADSIADLRIQPREWFTLCRRKTSEGREFFDLHTSANSARSSSPRQQQSTAPAPIPSTAAAIPQTTNSKSPASANAPVQATKLMSAAFISAIDAAKAAEQYAASQGIALEFGPDDFRAVAATIYIQACKDPLLYERLSQAA